MFPVEGRVGREWDPVDADRSIVPPNGLAKLTGIAGYTQVPG
jgi:hypothetical protein